MAIKFLADLDISGSEIQSFALENRTTDPSSASTGQIYFDTGNDEVKIYDGSNFIVVGKTYSAGNGISLSGTAFSVAGGDGLDQDAGGLSVDSTVIRTTGAQTKAGNMTFSNNVTVTGNLTVNGTQTILNTAELAVEDTNIELNSGASEGADSGISVNRGQGEDIPQLLWDESADRWTFTNNGSTFYNIPLSTEYNNFTYTLPTATASVLGGVKIGSGISISNGVISADSQTANDFTDALATKLDGIATGADAYGSWTISDGTNSETIGSGNSLIVDGTGATSVSYNEDTNTLTINSTDTNTNTQLSKETVQDYVGEMLTGNTETNITVTYDDANNKINFVATDTNTQLSTEAVQDIVGAMFSSNTETRITATYQDTDGTIDLVVEDQSYTLPNASAETLGGIKVGSNLSISDEGVLSATDTNTQLTNEQVQDIIGAMVSSNTETNISVTYNDTTGKLNFVSTDTDTTYSAGDGLSLSGTTFTNANSYYAVDFTADGSDYEVTTDTASVRVPAIVQLLDSTGRMVLPDVVQDSTNGKFILKSVPTGDYSLIIMGRRA
jgi:hypothetical protein